MKKLTVICTLSYLLFTSSGGCGDTSTDIKTIDDKESLAKIIEAQRKTQKEIEELKRNNSTNPSIGFLTEKGKLLGYYQANNTVIDGDPTSIIEMINRSLTAGTAANGTVGGVIVTSRPSKEVGKALSNFATIFKVLAISGDYNIHNKATIEAVLAEIKDYHKEGDLLEYLNTDYFVENNPSTADRISLGANGWATLRRIIKGMHDFVAGLAKVAKAEGTAIPIPLTIENPNEDLLITLTRESLENITNVGVNLRLVNDNYRDDFLRDLNMRYNAQGEEVTTRKNADPKNVGDKLKSEITNFFAKVKELSDSSKADKIENQTAIRRLTKADIDKLISTIETTFIIPRLGNAAANIPAAAANRFNLITQDSNDIDTTINAAGGNAFLRKIRIAGQPPIQGHANLKDATLNRDQVLPGGATVPAAEVTNEDRLVIKIENTGANTETIVANHFRDLARTLLQLKTNAI